MYVSVRLSTSPSIVRPSMCPSVRLMHIFVILFVALSVLMFFFSVRSSVRLSVRLVVFRQYECMPVSLLSVYISVTHLIPNFFSLLISDI